MELERRKIKTSAKIDDFSLKNYEFNNRYISFNTLEQWIKEAKNAGANHFEFTSYSDEDADLEAVILKDETDQEYNERLRASKELEDNRKAAQEKRDRATYEELKKRFENN